MQRFFIFATLALGFLPTPAHAQKDGVVMQPLQQMRLPELSDLIEAKVDETAEGLQLVVLAEAFRTEKQSGNVTKFRTEQRERKVVVNGKEVTQTYTVSIPFTEAGEVDVQIPAGRKPITIPVNSCEFFSLTGKSLQFDDIRSKLENLSPILLMDACRGELPGLPPIYAQAFKEDCFIVVTSKIVRESRKPTTIRAQRIVPLP